MKHRDMSLVEFIVCCRKTVTKPSISNLPQDFILPGVLEIAT